MLPSLTGSGTANILTKKFPPGRQRKKIFPPIGNTVPPFPSRWPYGIGYLALQSSSKGVEAIQPNSKRGGYGWSYRILSTSRNEVFVPQTLVFYSVDSILSMLNPNGSKPQGGGLGVYCT